MSALTPEQLGAMERYADQLGAFADPGSVADHSAAAIRMLAARVRELESAVAAEREACAALCDAKAAEFINWPNAAIELALEIRARGAR